MTRLWLQQYTLTFDTSSAQEIHYSRFYWVRLQTAALHCQSGAVRFNSSVNYVVV